jgi:Ser/Thr protein kinase RdoA (MazF antagonist)
MTDHVPPEVLSAFDISIEDSVSLFPNPWIEPHTYYVDRPSKGLVLRRWDGEERINRMQKESEILRLLHFVGFRKLPRPVYPADGKPWFIDGSEVGWTAYQYVRGSHISEASEDTARVAGKALAELHSFGNSMLAVYGEWSSRLLEIPDAIKRMLSVAKGEHGERINRIGQILESRIIPKLDELLTLPAAAIHGDYVLENIILSDSGTILVDFEFSRIDVRIFDHVGMIAPMRDARGDFVIADESFLRAFLFQYEEGHQALTPAEIFHFSMIAAARFCLIYDGLSKIGNPRKETALQALEFILSDGLRWVSDLSKR